MAKLGYRRILVIDDDARARMILARAVADAGGTPTLCASATDALFALARNEISAAILRDRISIAHPKLRRHLIIRRIPYVWHRDLTELHGSSARDNADALIDRIADLLSRRP